MSDPLDRALVSVVICTFRRPHLVVRAIKSVLSQTYTNIEAIVVDDASRDETGAVVRAISDLRLRYIEHEGNKGLPAGRNTGIEAARGEFVAFLDDDDEWMRNKLKRQLHFLISQGCDAVLCGAVRSDGNIRLFGRSLVTRNDLRRGNPFLPGSGLLARKTILSKLRFDESLRQGEDWDMLIRISQDYQIGYVNEVLYTVDTGEHQRMTNEARSLAGKELEKRTAIYVKHRTFFGDWWFRYWVAATLLSYVGSHGNLFQRIMYAARHCGFSAVVAVLAKRSIDHIARGMRRFGHSTIK